MIFEKLQQAQALVGLLAVEVDDVLRLHHDGGFVRLDLRIVQPAKDHVKRHNIELQVARDAVQQAKPGQERDVFAGQPA